MSAANQVCGMPLPDVMPDGWLAVDAVVCLKVLDDEGRVRVLTRATGGLTMVDAVGMVELARQRLLRSLDGQEGYR